MRRTQPIADEMVRLATSTAEAIAVPRSGDVVDLEDLSAKLHDARDVAQLLRVSLDRGEPVERDAIGAVERLLRATLKAYPFLQKVELDLLRARRLGSGVDRDKANLVQALRDRTLELTNELHGGLGGAWRALLAQESPA